MFSEISFFFFHYKFSAPNFHFKFFKVNVIEHLGMFILTCWQYLCLKRSFLRVIGLKFFSYVARFNMSSWTHKRKLSIKKIKVLFFQKIAQTDILCNKENTRTQQSNFKNLYISSLLESSPGKTYSEGPLGSISCIWSSNLIRLFWLSFTFPVFFLKLK